MTPLTAGRTSQGSITRLIRTWAAIGAPVAEQLDPQAAVPAASHHPDRQDRCPAIAPLMGKGASAPCLYPTYFYL